MIKKTVTYKDFDGLETTEDYYFHLSKGDLLDWTTEEKGGLVEKLQMIGEESDPINIIPIIKKILIRSYGVRTPDGKSFIKDPELVKNFQYSPAFSELYIELSTDAEKAVEFIEGIMPEFDEEMKNAIDEAKKQFEEKQKTKSEEK